MIVINQNSYLSPLKTKRIIFSVQGSRFISTLRPVRTEEAARSAIDSVRAEYPDATHHTYAYRIGVGSNLIERLSDDREPAGTAGAPMLQLLQGKSISDALVIATRYFGGTKLGIGGLTRAYRDCARLVLEEATLTRREPLTSCRLRMPYEDLGAVTRLAESSSASIDKVDYSETVEMQLTLPVRCLEELKLGFQSATRGRGNIVDTTSPKQI